MAGMLKSLAGDVGAAAHLLGDFSLDPTVIMLMAQSAECAVKAVAFRAQVRAAKRLLGLCARLWKNTQPSAARATRQHSARLRARAVYSCPAGAWLPPVAEPRG
jgi:hypothetical protein